MHNRRVRKGEKHEDRLTPQENMQMHIWNKRERYQLAGKTFSAWSLRHGSFPNKVTTISNICSNSIQELNVIKSGNDSDRICRSPLQNAPHIRQKVVY